MAINRRWSYCVRVCFFSYHHK